ncbi:MAG: hypothetical protein M4579_000597 [Chaenotheca gracillima]|nr:MAG: hypothetical protein M4579_000597 [Chaenotheca gracillima]
MASNELYQYSILSALMDGVSETGTTVSDLLKSGDLGLGTFSHMDGEMVVIDGKIYQLKADGTVPEAEPQAVVPFATVTRFQPTMFRQAPLPDKDSLLQLLTQMAPNTGNHFLSIRLEATFQSVTARTVPPQEYPGQKLSELGKKQVVRSYHNLKGSMVGFRSPQFSQGIAVAGDHIHFISEDRKCGGHVLEFAAADASVSVAVINKLHIDLPQSDEFNNAALERDEAGIKKVEG